MTIFTGQKIIPVSCDTESERIDVMILLTRLGVNYYCFEKERKDGKTLWCIDVIVK